MNGRKSREIRRRARDQWENNNPYGLSFRVFLKHYKELYRLRKDSNG